VRTIHTSNQSNPLRQEPDYSFQVITSQNWTRPPAGPRLGALPVMTPGPTRPYLWLNCLTMHTFVPCPQFFLPLKPIAHVCTLRMAKDELSAYSASSCGMSCHVINLSLPAPFLFTWCLGAGGLLWSEKSQEFGSWVQNSGWKLWYRVWAVADKIQSLCSRWGSNYQGQTKQADLELEAG
jgi:hypothetical protein